ncbi:MAG: GNAT family N-acetyltransferase [Sphaerochaetaceae bacterium]
MIIETDRLILRPWKESDAEDLYEFAKDPRVGPITGWPVHTKVEQSREIIKDILSKEGTFAVILKSENTLVGDIAIMVGNNTNLGLPEDEAEIGFWLGVPYWGRGIIPEAVKKLLSYGFETLHLNKIWCGYFDGNVKSKRVQEKCGFIYHHTNENKPWPVMNDVRTEHVSCITKEQWLNKDIKV